ncbi:MAG: alanine--tRNA ligase [Thermoplasmata archaeon]|jgi:alanyl-tRNA synthetase
MDSSEYDLQFFHKGGFHRSTCVVCGHAFWTLGDFDRCQEAPCRDYGFIGRPILARPYDLRTMRETYLTFFERHGHTRIRRYPTVARWRNDVFFTQASIYDFQPWVTNGTIPPPANPLTISQPVLRFIDLEEVGRSGRHFTLFEMMAHHAFNRPDHEVYFKERCTELCHELLTSELGVDPKSITYKEEVWEGGGNVGPSLSVSVAGLELATLVFMIYVRDGDRLKPMPLRVVDTGYGLERFVWASHGSKTAYEAVFGSEYDELRRTFPARETALLIDHARALNFLLTDGVVPSNSKEGYFVRLLLRRSLRILQKTPEAPDILSILDRAGREIARDFPEVGAHRDDLHQVVLAEVDRYADAITRARQTIRRYEERVRSTGGRVGEETLVEWYDSLGVPPDVAVEELEQPPQIPEDFYARVAERHEKEGPTSDYADATEGLPEVPESVPPTEVLYYLDPYTTNFEAHVVWVGGSFVALDRTYFYPTGGGQVTDKGYLGDLEVVDVARRGPWVLHHLERNAPFTVGERVRGKVDVPRRTQLMQHHTATHLLNGALREVLGPHVWQTGAYKGPEAARIDITHYRALSKEELHKVERRVNEVVREDRPVKSYFETRGEAERRFGFTLYQGGAVPGRDLRIVEVPGFDVEACGGTHCTHTSEVGAIALLDVERIQDGVVRLNYVSGERALDVREEHEAILREAARRLGVPVTQLPDGVERLLTEVEESRKIARERRKVDLGATATRLLADPTATETVGSTVLIVARVDLERNEMMELSRLLTRDGGRVALLASERDGRGIVFVGSTDPKISAQAALDAAKGEFAGKGGGNPSAATAVGEPGAPLASALDAARKAAREAARGGG